MGDRRMKNSKGAASSNFSLKCVKSVQKCISELKRAMQAMQFESKTIQKHEISVIMQCSQHLLAALTSCNLYRIHFSDEAYYLTQLQKIEKGVSQIFDFVTSLSCRKYFSSLGNNNSNSDLFSSLEDTFDSFVGPLLHIFNSFNVSYLLFESDHVHLFILDQLAKKPILKKLGVDLESLTTEDYPFLNNLEDEEEPIEETEGEKENSVESDIPQDENRLKDKWNELQSRYTRQVSDECISELAILIDTMAEGDAENYSGAFSLFYKSLFEQSVGEKIEALLRRVTSFKMLNKFAHYLFYNSEVMSLPLESIEEISEQSGHFSLKDLHVKLIRSAYVPLSHVPLNSSVVVPPGTVSTSRDPMFMFKNNANNNNNNANPNPANNPNANTLTNTNSGNNNIINVPPSFASSEQQKCIQPNFLPNLMVESKNLSYSSQSTNTANQTFTSSTITQYEACSSQLKVGEVIHICPHSFTFSDLCCVGNQEELTEEEINCCNFLKKQREQKKEEAEKNSKLAMMNKKAKTSAFRKMIVQEDTPIATNTPHVDDLQVKITMKGDEQKQPMYTKREVIFGRRAQNSMLRPDFYFEEHETTISRQQFKISYEIHSNEFNVQCLSQSSLTQLAVDSAGFELTPGSIIIVQDLIAFQVVALKTFPRESAVKELNKSDALQQLASNLSKSFLSDSNKNSNNNNPNSTDDSLKSASVISKKKHSSQKLSYRKTQMIDDIIQTPQNDSKDKDNSYSQSSSNSSSDDFNSDEDEDEDINDSHQDDGNKSGETTKEKENRRGSNNSQEGDDKTPRNRQGSSSTPSQQANLKKRKSLTTRKSSGADINKAVQRVAANIAAAAAAVTPLNTSQTNSDFEDNNRPPSQSDCINEDEATTDFKKSSQQNEKRESQMNLLLTTFSNATAASSASASTPQIKSKPNLPIQSFFEIEDYSDKQDAFLHLRVMWSSIETEKEDYLFQYSQDTDRQTIQIDFGSDPKLNQIHLQQDEGSTQIKPQGHCSIVYQDDVWAIVSLHDSLEHYAGLALKKSEEVENGLISKKILIEKGFNLLVQGYILACDL